MHRLRQLAMAVLHEYAPASIPLIDLLNATDVGYDNMVRARIVSSLISFLSMCGAVLIILSYICFRDVRTKGGEVLCNMSLADFGVACSNFIGAVVYFTQYIHQCDDDSSTLPLSCGMYNQLCKAQAFFAVYCMIASFLWTLVLALYVYVLILDTGRRLASRLVMFGYLFCWGMAALVAMWLVLTHRLGYTEHGGAGWCALRVEDKKGNFNRYMVFFASNLWSVSTFFMILILYCSVHTYVSMKVRERERERERELYHR